MPRPSAGNGHMAALSGGMLWTLTHLTCALCFGAHLPDCAQLLSASLDPVGKGFHHFLKSKPEFRPGLVEVGPFKCGFGIFQPVCVFGSRSQANNCRVCCTVCSMMGGEAEWAHLAKSCPLWGCASSLWLWDGEVWPGSFCKYFFSESRF